MSNASNLVGDDTNLADDVFVRDRVAGTTTRVSLATGGLQANDRSNTPSLSADGRYVVLASDATNLVVGDTNGDTDVFLHDRQTGETVRVSVATDGSEGPGDRWLPVFSGNGHFAAYQSVGTNLVPGDTNGVQDVFVTGRPARVHGPLRTAAGADGDRHAAERSRRSGDQHSGGHHLR
jgi:Tol biopolymer transport system component